MRHILSLLLLILQLLRHNTVQFPPPPHFRLRGAVYAPVLIILLSQNIHLKSAETERKESSLSVAHRCEFTKSVLIPLTVLKQVV